MLVLDELEASFQNGMPTSSCSYLYLGTSKNFLDFIFGVLRDGVRMKSGIIYLLAPIVAEIAAKQKK